MRRAVAPLALVLVALAGCGGSEARPPDSPRAAADRFLDRYVDRDGRVVRHDQGGDTVSEGQAYALLAAVAIGDERRFDRVWRWTRAELRRRDGLLAWRWKDGRVADAQPAADADLDAARALVLAAARFRRPALLVPARRMARGILRHERAGRRIVAGPWARRDRVVNPSYVAPGSYAALARIGRARAWRAIGRRARADAARLVRGPRLPPDWARAAGRRLRATGPPGTRDRPSYGYDAARLPIRLAEACHRRARRVAATLWPLLRRDSAAVPRALGGRPPGRERHPVALVAAAAAATAAGDRRARDRLLDEAAALDRGAPSYYGAAWVALGRLMLQTRALSPCRAA